MKNQKHALIFACSFTFLLISGCTQQNSSGYGSDFIMVQHNSPSTEYEKVKIYLPNANTQKVEEKEVQIEKNNEPMVELVQALVTEKALPQGTEVEKYSISKDDIPAITIDFNKDFADGLKNTGTTGENLMLESLLQTIWSYFTPASLSITVNGNVLETGHNIYDQPFTNPNI